jgi:hypothetical protein
MLYWLRSHHFESSLPMQGALLIVGLISDSECNTPTASAIESRVASWPDNRVERRGMIWYFKTCYDIQNLSTSGESSI